MTATTNRLRHSMAVIALAASLALPASAGAQAAAGLRVGLAQRPAAVPVTARDLKPTHWQEGMLIGAAVGAGFGVFVYEVAKGISDEPVGSSVLFESMLVGAAIFSLVGGLIGSAFPK
ncbi:MAG: hypothetical protein ACREL5_08945 [Gemmatimonadales bacterium]